MNKKVLIGVIIIILIIVVAVAGVIINKNNEPNVLNSNTNNDTENQSMDNETKISSNKKILVVYFSLPETTDPNNMTQEEENSSIVVDGKVLGNTQYVAQLITEKTGSDIYRIEAKEDYPLDHTTLVNQAKEEQNNDERPEIKGKIDNFDEYDTIFLGYPIWWSDMPQILYTFLESYNFNEKTVIPFSTHGGSGLAGTISTIKDKLSNSKVEENAFTMSRNNMEDAPEEVESWLKELNIIK